jgi:hypothetical protein
MKSGTLTISTRTSHSTSSRRKNPIGSAMFFQEAFTAYLLKESARAVKETGGGEITVAGAAV